MPGPHGPGMCCAGCAVGEGKGIVLTTLGRRCGGVNGSRRSALPFIEEILQQDRILPPPLRFGG
jgi:hypothetical protein